MPREESLAFLDVRLWHICDMKEFRCPVRFTLQRSDRLLALCQANLASNKQPLYKGGPSKKIVLRVNHFGHASN